MASVVDAAASLCGSVCVRRRSVSVCCPANARAVRRSVCVPRRVCLSSRSCWRCRAAPAGECAAGWRRGVELQRSAETAWQLLTWPTAQDSVVCIQPLPQLVAALPRCAASVVHGPALSSARATAAKVYDDATSIASSIVSPASLLTLPSDDDRVTRHCAATFPQRAASGMTLHSGLKHSRCCPGCLRHCVGTVPAAAMALSLGDVGRAHARRYQP